MSVAIEKHFQHLAQLLVEESRAEAARLAERLSKFSGPEAERSGVSLLDLTICDAEPGLGGKFIVQLMKRHRDQAFPWNRFKVGSPVVLSTTQQTGNQQTWQAVVCGRSQNEIKIACEQLPEGDRLRLDFSSDEITLQRQLGALNAALNASGRSGTLRDILLGIRQPKFSERVEISLLSNLNPSQKNAVEHALAAHDLAIIHGPPGTGKTTTVVEFIRQAVLRGEKVLACAPSNTAVDNLVEKLSGTAARIVRIGHPARVLEHVREHSLDMIVESDESTPIARRMIKEAEALFRKADRFTRAKPAPGARQEMRREAKQLKADARRLERQVIKRVLDGADVVLATMTGDMSVLEDRYFDTAVIDEACQSTEPGCWIPVLQASRLVLAGDHFQLPPTVVSSLAARAGLAISMLERLNQCLGNQVTRQLDVQYRMHHQIACFSSQQFYEGSLQAHESVREHLLCDLPATARSELTETPVLFIDTAGASFDEKLEPEGQSKFNAGEAKVIIRLMRELIQAGMSPDQIAVIAPYAAQVRLIRELAERENSEHEISRIEIDTVDGFQGREKEAILISLVRSNATGEIGFLGDQRRMNVALTRARRKLILVGDSATLGQHSFYKNMLNYFESINCYRSVWELGFVE